MALATKLGIGCRVLLHRRRARLREPRLSTIHPPLLTFLMASNPAARAEALIEALPFIQKFRGQLFVIKYGGSAMEDEQIVERFLRDVVFLEAVGINPVLIHGGGKSITSRMREIGQKPRFVNGLRVTDEQSIRIVE